MKKSSTGKGLFRPFEGLKLLLDDRSIQLQAQPSEKTADAREAEPRPDQDQALFDAAMADVEKLPPDTCADPELQKITITPADNTEDVEALMHLKELVKTGKGFIVADTDEYVEGTGYNVNRAVAKRLHSGEYAVQGHIDLHGQSVDSARLLVDQFLKDSITTGKRMILIVHGRGLSSPAEPVLKSKVIRWITTGVWRKWVMAYSSARLCDGGAGATYVLLRRRPATRRLKKKRSFQKNDLTKMK
jgi:DNA-nicking Smr family endonuclease